MRLLVVLAVALVGGLSTSCSAKLDEDVVTFAQFDEYVEQKRLEQQSDSSADGRNAVYSTLKPVFIEPFLVESTGKFTIKSKKVDTASLNLDIINYRVNPDFNGDAYLSEPTLNCKDDECVIEMTLNVVSFSGDRQSFSAWLY